MTLLILTPFIFSIGFFLGTLWASRQPQILRDHDPEKPFTAEELRAIGIRPPEAY